MDITDGIQEVLTRAEMFRESRGAAELCEEDLLQGLLWLALHGESEPGCAEESAAARTALRKSIDDLAETERKLERLAGSGAVGFTAADAILARAEERSGAGELNAETLCRILMESADAVIKSLCCSHSEPADDKKLPFDGKNPILFGFEPDKDFGRNITQIIREDLDLTPPDPENGSVPPEMIITGSASDSLPDPDDPVMRELQRLISGEKSGETQKTPPETQEDKGHKDDGDEVDPCERALRELLEERAREEKERKEREERERREREEKERKEREERERREREERERREREERERREREQKEREARKKRRTKLGLFTYRGGKVAAAIQYFLYGVFVPLLLFVVLELISLTPSPEMYDIIMVFWGYYLLRGVLRIVGFGSEFFGHFLITLQDVLTVRILEKMVSSIWYAGASPLWLRAVSCLGMVAALLFGIRRFEAFPDREPSIKGMLLFSEERGSFAKIFFRYLTKKLLIVVAVYSVFYIFSLPLRPWIIRSLWILGFFWAWCLFYNFYDCLGKRAVLPEIKERAHKRLIDFLEAAHIGLGSVELALLLIGLFNWTPMKLWVWVLLAVWSLYALIAAVSAAKN